MRKTSRISGKITPELLGRVRIALMIRNGRSTAKPLAFNGFIETALRQYCDRLEAHRDYNRERRRKASEAKRDARNSAAKERDEEEYRKCQEEE